MALKFMQWRSSSMFKYTPGLAIRYFSNYAENSKEQVSFGFQLTDKSRKSDTVYNVFRDVAPCYDFMNDAISMGIHRIWKDRFVETLYPTPGLKLLDVAGGTGDIAFRVLQYLKTLNEATSRQSRDTPLPKDFQSSFGGHHHLAAEDSNIVVCDINPHMLNVGKDRAKTLGWLQGLSWVCADAEQLPIDGDTFDAYTISFGIRNVTNIEKVECRSDRTGDMLLMYYTYMSAFFQVLSEAHRVLRPGGHFLCLEFSNVVNPLLRRIYDSYSFQVIPVLGQLLAGDWKSYQYLVESIRLFPDQETFADMIRSSGFSMVHYTNFSMGIVAVHSGFKL